MIAEALIRLGFTPDVDFVCQDDGDGPYLREWRSKEAQPSDEDIEEAAALPPRRQIAKSVVISRLTDQQLDIVIAAMTTRQRERWRSPDSPHVWSDDAEVIGMLKAIGADPKAVLAE